MNHREGTTGTTCSIDGLGKGKNRESLYIGLNITIYKNAIADDTTTIDLTAHFVFSRVLLRIALRNWRFRYFQGGAAPFFGK